LAVSFSTVAAQSNIFSLVDVEDVDYSEYEDPVNLPANSTDPYEEGQIVIGILT